MNERERDNLSEEGRLRREAMLGTLLGEMRAVHARRKKRRTAAVYASVAMMLALAVAVATPWRGAQVSREVAVDTPEGATEVAGPFDLDPPRVVVKARIVRTDPSAAERYIVRTGAHRGTVLSDAELIDTLEEIGRPAGLVRTNGRAWLTAAVTDEERRDGS